MPPEYLPLAMLEDPDGSAAVVLREVGLDRDVLVQSAAEHAALDDRPLGYKGRLEEKRQGAS